MLTFVDFFFTFVVYTQIAFVIQGGGRFDKMKPFCEKKIFICSNLEVFLCQMNKYSVNYYNNPPASKASREVANLTVRKNPHTPVYGVKEFVFSGWCLTGLCLCILLVIEEITCVLNNGRINFIRPKESLNSLTTCTRVCFFLDICYLPTHFTRRGLIQRYKQY